MYCIKCTVSRASHSAMMLRLDASFINFVAPPEVAGIQMRNSNAPQRAVSCSCTISMKTHYTVVVHSSYLSIYYDTLALHTQISARHVV